MRTHIENLKTIFENDPFQGPSGDDMVSRMKERFAVGSTFQFRKTGKRYEVLSHPADGSGIFATVVGMDDKDFGQVGMITWDQLASLLRIQMIEDKDPFQAVDPEELSARKGVDAEKLRQRLDAISADPITRQYAEWGSDNELPPIVAEVFAKFMVARWGARQLRTAYGEEWLDRFARGAAYAYSDGEGQRVLRELGVFKGVDNRGYITDDYRMNEAYRMRRSIKKEIDMSPEDLPYTYEDIISLPEYKELVDLPYVTDVTTPIQRNRRAVSFMFSGQELNEADDPFQSAAPEDVKVRRAEQERLKKIIKKNEQLRYARQDLEYALNPKRYTIHANGYIRSHSVGWGGGETTNVIKLLDPALELDDYRALLKRLGSTFDKKVKRIKVLKARYQEHLRQQGITEAEDPFQSASPEDIERREDAYRKKIGAETNAWQDIAKRELEIELGVTVDYLSNSGGDYFSVETSDGGQEWIVFEDDDAATSYAENEVENMLMDDPAAFSGDWLTSYIYMSDTDRRMYAQEEADSLVQDIDDDELLADAYMDDEYEKLQEEIDELYELDPDDPRAEDADEMIRELSDKQEEMIDNARDEWIEKKYDEIYEELNDPIDYFVHTQGMYSMEDLLDASFIQIDYQEAAEDAVNQDGAAHFIAHYDGDQTDLPSGAVAFRTN